MEINTDETEFEINNNFKDDEDNIEHIEANSIFDLLNSKSENFRKKAYLALNEELKNLRNEEVEDFLNKYINYLYKLLEDTNYISLEPGLDLIINILQNFFFKLSLNQKSEIFKLIIEKTYSTTKTPCKLKAQDIISIIYSKSINDKLIYDEILKKILDANKPKVSFQKLIIDDR